MNVVFAIAISLTAMGCPPNDPGTIVVVAGNLQPLQFSLPSGVSYRVNYNSSRLAVWFDPTQTMPVASNVTYQAPVVFAHGDMNANGRIDGADIQLFVDVFTGANTDPDKVARADFDQNSVINSNDTGLFVTALLTGAAVPPAQVTFYAQGVSASASLCDTPVDILTDEDENGTFVLAGTVETTIVSLTTNPTMGPLGTPVTVTIAPAIAPLVFNASTTASWTGVFQPMVGSPSAMFQIQYGAAQVREQSASQAILIVGDGSLIGAPDGASFGSGSFVGTLAVNFGTLVNRPFTFMAGLDSATWEQVSYPDGPGGIEPPVIDGEPDSLDIMMLSVSPSPTNPSEDMLVHASGFHIAAVVRIAENATTSANAPNSITVDLVSLDQNGAQLDRIEDVVLTQLLSDGDPLNIIYVNDLQRPIVLVDIDLDNLAYPNVIPFRLIDGGSAGIVPASN